MGVSFHTYIVAGVEAKDIMRLEEVKSFVKKFNQDTGEPYQKANITYKQFCGNVEVRESDVESMLYEINKKLNLKLECAGGGYDPEYIIGKEVSHISAHSDEHFKSFSIEDLNAAAQFVKEELKKIGYEGPIKFFHLGHLS